MEIVTCPDLNMRRIWDNTSIFLAGGISNCPDWQEQIIPMLQKEFEEGWEIGDDICLINPRRKDFDITDPTMSIQQIHWEHKRLADADVTLFWFPEETLCPITLFELGKQAAQERNIVVGTHPGYARGLDVRVQLELLAPHVRVVTSLEDLVAETCKFVYNEYHA